MALNLKRTDAWERLPWECLPWERHLAATLTNPFLLDKPHRISHGQDAAPIEATEVA